MQDSVTRPELHGQYLDPVPGRDLCASGRASPHSSRWAGGPAWATATPPRTSWPSSTPTRQDPQRIVELLRGQVSQATVSTCSIPEVFDPTPKPNIAGCQAADRGAHAPARPTSSTAWRTPAPTTTSGWFRASCEYVKETGDLAFLDQVIAFADGEVATVYEHIKRALDFSAEQVGSNGDVQGPASRLERLSESRRRRERPWFPSCTTGPSNAFIEAARYLGRTADVQKYTAMAERVRQAVRSGPVGRRMVSARLHPQGHQDRLARERRG